MTSATLPTQLLQHCKLDHCSTANLTTTVQPTLFAIVFISQSILTQIKHVRGALKLPERPFYWCWKVRVWVVVGECIWIIASALVLWWQARVQVQGLSQISNKRPGPGACYYNCNVSTTTTTHPPPNFSEQNNIEISSCMIWLVIWDPSEGGERVRRRFGRRVEYLGRIRRRRSQDSTYPLHNFLRSI